MAVGFDKCSRFPYVKHTFVQILNKTSATSFARYYNCDGCTVFHRRFENTKCFSSHFFCDQIQEYSATKNDIFLRRKTTYMTDVKFNKYHDRQNRIFLKSNILLPKPCDRFGVALISSVKHV